MLDSEPFVCLRVDKFDDPYLFKSLIISNIDDKILMSVFRFKKFNVVNERRSAARSCHDHKAVRQKTS